MSARRSKGAVPSRLAMAVSPPPRTVTGMSTPRTVPIVAAQLVLGGEVVSCPGVVVGERVEADLEALAAAGEAETAGRLAGFYGACQQLWAERDPDSEVVHVQRLLSSRQQIERNSKAEGRVRVYLSEEVEAFGSDPLLAELRELLLTTGTPEVSRAVRLVEGRGGQVEDTVNDRGTRCVTVTVPIVAGVTTPAALGGPAGPGELRRVVRFTARYAASADRAAKRLAACEVSVDEVYPDPAAWRA